ncbi:uncharacterized protein LOC118800488 [Colossoma macropomum]|uniref:uncharacterized protein LOC118800488 n=1 Tax=Colossoma macropomum TaxID=42526 RepID=UPI001863BB75|nr:uncharacterized protein LOC118800488 [Colossoma macropomum]
MKKNAHLKLSVMQSCSSAVCILILLITTFTDALTDKMTTDSGVYTSWGTTNYNTEVYPVSTEELIDTMQSGSGEYPTEEDDSDLLSTVVIKTGKSIVLDLDASYPVEVIYSSRSAAGPSWYPICTVNGCSLQCKPEYTQRVSLLTSAIVLREVKPSDSGVYIIWDTEHNNIIHIYTVTVQGLSSTVQIKAGESLVMKLDVSDPVEVIYNRTGGQICTVDRGSLSCTAEYMHRVSLLTSDLELREMKPSDSGVYIIRDTKTKEDIDVYTVTVRGNHTDLDTVWVMVLVAVLVAVIFLAITVVILQNRRQNQPLQKEDETNRVQMNELIYVSPEERQSHQDL